MMILITNIKELVQTEAEPRELIAGRDMAELKTIKDAFLLIEDSKIKDFGPMTAINKQQIINESAIRNHKSEIIDASGRMVFPCFCDSHTHLVYAGSRENEFVDKIKGLSYEEIYKRGGGILNSAKKLHDTSEAELSAQALERIEEIKRYGTGAVEIKSGYGLTVDDELKMLRVIRGLKESSSLTIKSTFLGAHAVPLDYKNKQGEYVNLIINEMLPKVADEGLADFIDVFCDKGFFTPDETSLMLEAAAKYGLLPKIHANELDYSGGVQVGAKHNALSVDHLEFTGDDEINVLLNNYKKSLITSDLGLRTNFTMPTLLPAAAFFLGLIEPPARKIIDAGLPLALASDFNPGSSPSGNMQFVMSLGCIKLKMLPEEAINAATLNSAYAMGVNNTLGSIAKGKIANVFITNKIPSYQFMPYSFGTNNVETVILNGKIV